MKKTRVSTIVNKAFYPLLFCVYPILLIYSGNMDSVEFSNAVTPIILSLSGTLFLMGLFYLISRDINKAALIASLFLIMFFSYGHMHSAIYKHLVIADIKAGKDSDFYKQLVYWCLIGSWIVVLFFSTIKIVRSKNLELIAKTAFPINSMAAILITMPIATILINVVTADNVSASESKNNTANDNLGINADVGYLPDIYYIILDGYARNDFLKKYYDFDNKEFIDNLKDKGFFVAKRSRSNYFWTQLSLTSSLNMEHIQFFSRSRSKIKKNNKLLNKRIRENEVRKYLKRLGYKYVHLASTYEVTRDNSQADMQIDCSKGTFKNEFYRTLAESTLLKSNEQSISEDLSDCHLENMKTLANIPGTIKGPKFVFSHFVPPHHPYLFDRDGNVLRQATVSNQFEFQKYLWFDRKKYVDQIVYLNKRFTEIVRAIQESSKRQPVIIIQSDHGPQLLDPENKRKEHKDFKNARSANFVAVYTPKAKNIIPDNVTPVNLFRLLFNYYFNDDKKILPNTIYYSGFHRPYEFKKWTPKIKKAN
ncbi:MAG: hypothetical protein GY854_09725 [Deltaproteobacteria bacterium]|nr:hypothetical protein [Deltaproteobacteria bacterium]